MRGMEDRRDVGLPMEGREVGQGEEDINEGSVWEIEGKGLFIPMELSEGRLI